MTGRRLGVWLRRLRGTATLAYIAALCLAVALVVIGFIPGSPVTVELPTSALSALSGLGGVAKGAVVDSRGVVAVTIGDPSLAQRIFYLGMTVPGLLVVAEVARRMAAVLRVAEHSDPFTAQTARQLTVVAKITAFGGLGAWALSAAAHASLAATVLYSGVAVEPGQSPVGWLAVGLIVAAFAQLIEHGVAMRTELDTVI